MILQALVQYYEALLARGEIDPRVGAKSMSAGVWT